MRKQTTALDKKAGRRRKQENPAGIGSLGDKNASLFKFGVARIRNYADRSAHNARTAADPLALVAGGFFRCAGTAERISLIDDTARFETIIRRVTFTKSRELFFPGGSEGF